MYFWRARDFQTPNSANKSTSFFGLLFFALDCTRGAAWLGHSSFEVGTGAGTGAAGGTCDELIPWPMDDGLFAIS